MDDIKAALQVIYKDMPDADDLEEAVKNAAIIGATSGFDRCFSILSDEIVSLPAKNTAAIEKALEHIPRMSSELIKDELAGTIGQLQNDLKARQKRDMFSRYGLGVLVVLVPIMAFIGYFIGVQTGHSLSRDEVAAANWANTPDGKAARLLASYDPANIAHLIHCDMDGWHISNGECLVSPYTSDANSNPLHHGWRVKPH